MAIYSVSFVQALAFFILSSSVLVSGQGNPGKGKNCTGPTACEEDGSCGSCKTSREDDPGCSCSGCECVVCQVDPFCCAKEWDHICVGMAEELCNCVVFPTATPSASPSASPLPTFQPYPANVYFTISGLYYTSVNGTGIYAANTDGLGGPPSRIYPSSESPMTAIASTSCDLRRLYWTTDSTIMHASIDGSESPTLLYSSLNYVDRTIGGMNSLYDFSAIAVDEDSGKIFVGSRSGGLFMVERDGSSVSAEVLEEPSDALIFAVTIDPMSGNLYYFGRNNNNDNNNNDGFVKLLRPPYDTQSPRILYTTESSIPSSENEYYFQNTGDIAIDTSSNSLFFLTNKKVYKAPLDGTAPTPEILFDNFPFNRSSSIRTLDLYMGQMFLGVFSPLTGNTTIWEANADGTGAITKLYDFPRSPTDFSNEVGITGLVVLTCGTPTESPTPCSPKDQTFLIYPRSNTFVPKKSLTVPFVMKVEWEVAEIQSIYVVIEKKQNGTLGEWKPYERGVAVDPTSGIRGAYVHMHTLEEVGTYRWLVRVNITDSPCQVEDNTDWQTFSV